MTNETIIKKWRIGLTTIQVAKDYMDEYNKEAKKEKRTKNNKRSSFSPCRTNYIRI